jgi:hypothetical protein
VALDSALHLIRDARDIERCCEVTEEGAGGEQSAPGWPFARESSAFRAVSRCSDTRIAPRTAKRLKFVLVSVDPLSFRTAWTMAGTVRI